MGKHGNPVLRHVAAAFAVALLAACGTSGDVSSLLVQPGKYDIYTCPQIADRMQEVVAQDQKLEALMARASKETSGEVVNAIAYDPEYQANRGEMRELQKSAAAKNCPATPSATPASHGSDSAVR